VIDQRVVSGSPSSPLLLPTLAYSERGLREILVCAFVIAYLVALGDSGDCGFPITLGDRRHLVKALVCFWIIDETLSTNLYTKCV